MEKKFKECMIITNDEGGEYLASKKTSKSVLAGLKDNYKIRLLNLRKINWKNNLIKNIKGFNGFCFIAIHGGFGENGELQKFLEKKKISYTNSDSRACNIISNKHLTKILYRNLGIKTPNWFFKGKFFGDNDINFKKMSFFLKKPIYGGSRIGIKIVKNLNKKDKFNIFEEIIDGDFEISVGVIRNNGKIISLTPIIRKRNIKKIFFLKNFNHIIFKNKKILKKCSKLARLIYSSIGCNGIIKTDFLIDNNFNIWAIETDALPGLSTNNSVVLAAKKYGISYKKLLNIIIKDIRK